MKISRRPRAEAEIPQSSLSDMSFLLLVFFLSTTTFDSKRGLGLVLPEMKQESAVEVKLADKNKTTVEITEDGTVVLAKVAGERIDENLTPDQLKDRIHDLVKQNPEMVIILKTHRLSKYADMVTVLDKLQLAGAERIALATNAAS